MARRTGQFVSNRSVAASRAAAAAGEYAKALVLAQAAIKQEPRSSDALFLAAMMLQRLGRLPEAIGYYERSIEANANVADAHHNLGCALLGVRRIDEAVVALRRAIALRPEYPEALDALGYALAESGAPEKALMHYERSLELNDQVPAVRLRFADLLLKQGRYAEARAQFAAARERDPESTPAREGLATASFQLGQELIESGDIGEAVACFEDAIALEPGNASFYLPLVTAGPTYLKPVHRDALNRLAASAAVLPPQQQSDLHFALGNVDEREGRVKPAFEHLQRANALKRALIAYDEPAALAYTRSLATAFGGAIMEQLRGCGEDSERPIFIVGMPRSGSTLLEQLLAAHPDVAGGDETGVLGPIVRDVWPTIAASTIDELRTHVRAIGTRYLRATDDLAMQAKRLTDKTLDNVQLVPLIHVILPNARIIHITRDPLDSAFSCFATSFSGSQVPFSYDLHELGSYYRVYLELMERWCSFVRPDRLLEVRYEDLVRDFEPEARRIIAFCGLSWDPACRAFHQARRRVRTASNVQVRQPLYSSSIGRAQPFLAQLAPFAEALAGRDVGEQA
jgi:tetratricopeptide (TPR) repeat protein